MIFIYSSFSSSSFHGFITNQFEDLLPVGLLIGRALHWYRRALWGSNPVQAWIFFSLSFRNCKSCVYNCNDLPSYNCSLRSSHIWFSNIHNFQDTQKWHENRGRAGERERPFFALSPFFTARSLVLIVCTDREPVTGHYRSFSAFCTRSVALEISCNEETFHMTLIIRSPVHRVFVVQLHMHGRSFIVLVHQLEKYFI